MTSDLLDAAKVSIIIGSIAIWGNALLQSLGLPDDVTLEAVTIFVLAYATGYALLMNEDPAHWPTSKLLLAALAIAGITAAGNATTDAAGVPDSLFAEWVIADFASWAVFALTIRLSARPLDD